MSQSSWRSLREHLRRLAGTRAVEESSDADLLRRWIDLRDESAFELVVWRHGGMVLDLCRRMLSSAQEAEDAFQATFLVLVKKAKSVRQRESLASWLYKVAVRISLAARARSARNQAAALPADSLPAPELGDDLAQQERKALVSEEVARLPERYRTPIVLCYLQGKTVDQASALIGCPRWTLATRLARAKERLRVRLKNRHLAISSAALTAMLTQASAGSAATAALVRTTVANASAYTIQGVLPAGVSPAVAFLVQEGLRAPLLPRLAAMLVFGFFLAAVGTSWALSAGAWSDHPQGPAAQHATIPADAPSAKPVEVGSAEPDDLPPAGPEDKFLGLGALPVVEVGPDGKSLKVAVAQRSPGVRELSLRLGAHSFCLFSWIRRGQARPTVGFRAARIHVSTRAEDYLTRAHFNGKEQSSNRPARAPDVQGTVLAVEDGATRLVVEVKEEQQQQAVRLPILLTAQTRELYLRVLTGGAEPRVGYRATVWLAEGSTEQADTVWFDTRHNVPSR